MSVCVSVWTLEKSFTGKLKLTYSELFFSAEKHASNFKILAAAQRVGISTSEDHFNTRHKFSHMDLCNIAVVLNLPEKVAQCCAQ